MRPLCEEVHKSCILEITFERVHLLLQCLLAQLRLVPPIMDICFELLSDVALFQFEPIFRRFDVISDSTSQLLDLSSELKFSVVDITLDLVAFPLDRGLLPPNHFRCSWPCLEHLSRPGERPQATPRNGLQPQLRNSD